MHQSENIKIKLITIINKDEYSWLIILYARVNGNHKLLITNLSDLRSRWRSLSCTIGIVSLSHTLQKSSYAAVVWFPISTAECIGLMLNPKTNANKAGAIGLVSEKYDDQIRSAANMESQSAAASDLIRCKELYSQ